MNVISDLAPEGQPPVAPVGKSPDAKHPLISDIESGNFGGVYLPAGFDVSEAKALIPDWDSAVKLGLDFYDPQSEDVEMVIFNPAKIKPEQVQQADFDGTLKDLLQPATAYFKAGTSGALEGEADYTEGTEQKGARLQTMPMQGSTPDQQLTEQRAKNATDVTEPSKRAIPGAGVILNDLVKRAI